MVCEDLKPAQEVSTSSEVSVLYSSNQRSSIFNLCWWLMASLSTWLILRIFLAQFGDPGMSVTTSSEKYLPCSKLQGQWGPYCTTTAWENCWAVLTLIQRMMNDDLMKAMSLSIINIALRPQPERLWEISPHRLKENQIPQKENLMFGSKLLEPEITSLGSPA